MRVAATHRTLLYIQYDIINNNIFCSIGFSEWAGFARVYKWAPIFNLRDLRGATFLVYALSVEKVDCCGARDPKTSESSPTRNQINNATRKQKIRKSNSNFSSNNRLSQMKPDNRQQCNFSTSSRPRGSHRKIPEYKTYIWDKWNTFILLGIRSVKINCVNS